MARLSYKKAGYYFGYKSSLEIKDVMTISTKNNFRIDYEVNSNDNGQPSSSSVSIYNLSTDHANLIQKGQYAIVRSGVDDMFGIIGEGNITSIKSSTDGKDHVTTLSITEGKDYSQTGKIQNNQTTSKQVSKTRTVKNKNYSPKAKKKSDRSKTTKQKYKVTQHKTKKVNVAFRKGTKAKQIIKTICSRSGIKLGYAKLGKNKVYKKGYTLSQKPFQALKTIASDCDAMVYYRKNKIVIDNLSDINPFKEQIYLDIGGGVRQEPSQQDQQDQSQPQFDLECMEDPRISAGSAVYVDTDVLSKLTRVKSCKHSKSANDYSMELVVYG